MAACCTLCAAGKRVPLSELTLSEARGRVGQTCIKLAKGDALAAVRLLHPEEEVVLGTVSRCHVSCGSLVKLEFVHDMLRVGALFSAGYVRSQ